MESSVTKHGSRHGVAWRRLASFLLLVPSLELAFYAGILPSPLGLERAVILGGFAIDWVLTPLGIAGIIAAIGVWRGQPWARVAAAVAMVLILAITMWLPLQMGQVPTSIPDVIGLWGIPLVLAGTALFALARRWNGDGPDR
jgi:hypothetical protein